MVTTVTRLWQFLIYLNPTWKIIGCMLKKYLLRNQRANGTSTMLDVQLYGDGQVIYRITGKLYGYLISVVFCDQLRFAEMVKIAWLPQ
jgi:hypothetical protein